VAAINGHAYAGGLITAFDCDHRIAAEGALQFALSEVPIGIPMPALYCEIIKHAVGPRVAGLCRCWRVCACQRSIFARRARQGATGSGHGLATLAIAELSQLLANRKITSRQLVEQALAAIKDPRGEGSCTFLGVHESQALTTADQVDAQRRDGAKPHALAGFRFRLTISSTKLASRRWPDRKYS
jgi:enoyl-CoA hydratase/carnithine racemase